MHAPLYWYAIEVASHKEKTVASTLTDKGFECFLPLYTRRRMWSDRIKVSVVPLFDGYVFCRFDVCLRMPVLMTPAVRAIVANGHIPAAIPERELDAIRIALQHGFPVEPCDTLNEGDRVRVTRGALAGVEGTFVRHRGSDRLIVSVSLIQRSVSMEIDRLCVEPVNPVRSLPGAVEARGPVHRPAREQPFCI
jgi:transcription antitermination factor NusG